MSFPRYAKYRNSGVAWLGDVPAHWSTVALKRVSPSQTVGIVVNPSDYVADEGLPFLYGGDIQEGRIDLDGCRRITHADSDRNPKTKLQAGDLVTVRVGAPGVTAVVPAECQGGNCASVMLIRRGTFDSRWLCYVMNDRVVRYQVEIVQYGAAQEQFNISHAVNFIVPKPSLDEQVAIADHLDNQTAKIDALVKEQRRLIKLLKEKRQAVISRAVTAGLNPNAPTKDSGVEWLGKVPAHWIVCALRRVIATIEQGWSPECDASPADENSWGVLKAGCVNRGVFNPSENKSLPSTLAPVPEYEVRPGDVLVSRASGSPELVGSTALVGETRGKLMLSDKIFRMHLNPQMASTFFVWAMNGKALRDQIERALSGGNGLANNLPQSAMLGFLVAVPPIAEQLAIASAVEDSVRRCDELVAQADCAVDLLLERRAALISAAVTGKIDVRGLVSQPEAEAA